MSKIAAKTLLALTLTLAPVTAFAQTDDTTGTTGTTDTTGTTTMDNDNNDDRGFDLGWLGLLGLAGLAGLRRREPTVVVPDNTGTGTRR